MANGGDAMRARGSNNPEVQKPITLDEIGIDKNLAKRARKYAAVPNGKFETIVDDWRQRMISENERIDRIRCGSLDILAFDASNRMHHFHTEIPVRRLNSELFGTFLPSAAVNTVCATRLSHCSG